jgi:hypothetical protein
MGRCHPSSTSYPLSGIGFLTLILCYRGSKMNFRTPDCSLTAKIGLFWVGVKYSLLYYQQSGVIPPDLTVGISATKKTLDNQHDIQ